jgi:Tfp pilus assembly protein PilW
MNPILMSLKYNKAKGYILIELMISIVIYSLIIATMLTQYQKFHKLNLDLTLKLTNLHNLQKAMLMITEDINRCGAFGVYNMHYINNPTHNVQYGLCNLNKFISARGLYSQENLISIAYGINIGTYITNSSHGPSIEESKEISFFYNYQNIDVDIILFSDYNTLYSCYTKELNPRIINNQLLNFTLSNNCYVNSHSLRNTLHVMNLTIKNYFLKDNNLYYQEISPNCQSYTTAELLLKNVKAMTLYYYFIDNNSQILISKNIANLTSPLKIIGVYLAITDQTNNIFDSFIPF